MINSSDYELSSGNIFEDLEFANAEQEILKAKLALFINKTINERTLTQSNAAKIMGITQPDVSNLRNQHYERFTADRLFKFLTKLNYDIEINIVPTQGQLGHIRLDTH